MKTETERNAGDPVAEFKKAHAQKFEMVNDFKERAMELLKETTACMLRLDAENQKLKAELSKLRGSK